MGRERTSRYWVHGGLIVFLAALIFFAPAYGWRVRDFLSPPPAASATDEQAVEAQNAALKAQIAQLQAGDAQGASSASDTVLAMVYSRYPMNFKNELLVSAGTNEGVAQGDAVMFQGVLIGQVKSAYAGSSLVQTIFDDSVKMPVRIGSGGYDGLLQGGSEPALGSIAATAPVTVGDVVYSAEAGLPYGLPIAEVTATSTSPDSLFEQAAINVSYDINNVQAVDIMK